MSGPAADDLHADWANQNDQTGWNTVDPTRFTSQPSIFNELYPYGEAQESSTDVVIPQTKPLSKPSLLGALKAWWNS